MVRFDRMASSMKKGINKWVEEKSDNLMTPLKYNNDDNYEEEMPQEINSLLKKIEEIATNAVHGERDLVLFLRLKDTFGIVDETSLTYGVDLEGYPYLYLYPSKVDFFKRNEINSYIKEISNPFAIITQKLTYYYFTYVSPDERDRGLTERYIIVTTRKVKENLSSNRLFYSLEDKTDNPIISNLISFYRKNSTPVVGNLGMADDVDIFILTTKKFYKRYDPKLKIIQKFIDKNLNKFGGLQVVSFMKEHETLHPDMVIRYDNFKDNFAISSSDSPAKIRALEKDFPGLLSQLLTNKTGDWFLHIHKSDFIILITRGKKWRKKIMKATSKRSLKYDKGRQKRWQSDIHNSDLVLIDGSNIHRRTM